MSISGDNPMGVVGIAPVGSSAVFSGKGRQPERKINDIFDQDLGFCRRITVPDLAWTVKSTEFEFKEVTWQSVHYATLF